MASGAAHNIVELGTAVGPQIHAILRGRIIRNEVEPGARLSESEIAASFSTSRQPVREAFIKLAEEGLLDVRPQRGTYVRKISTDAVMDARFVREAIEADIVKLLAQAADPVLASELKSQLKAQAAAKSPDAFIALDELFHRTLAEAAGKARAWAFVENLKAQMDRVRHLSLLRFPMAKLMRQHKNIASAIAVGDPVAAEQAMRAHLREILNDLPAICEDHPDFFDQKRD